MTRCDMWLFIVVSFGLCSRGHNPIRHFQFQIYGTSVADEDFKSRLRRQSGYVDISQATDISQSNINGGLHHVEVLAPQLLASPAAESYPPAPARTRKLPVALPTFGQQYGQQSGSLNGPQRTGGGRPKSKVKKPTEKTSKYYYPPRMPLPLPSCFHNPTGYVCCNRELNDLIVDTYTELEVRPRFHVCNINALAKHLQVRAQEKFTTDFETVVSFEDFAQKIHFKNDLVCKVEVGGKYMLAYGTVRDVVAKIPNEEPHRRKRDYNITSILI